MGLKAIIDNLDNVDEKYHDLYDEKDGKYVLKPIDGMKSQAEFQTVHSALQKERNDHKSTKGKLSAFGDLNPDEVRTALDRIPELEAAAEGKLDDAKIEKIVEGRLKSKVSPLERELTQAKAQLTEKDNQLVAFQQREKSRTIKDFVEAAARETKVLPTAMEDVVLLAERHLEVTEDNRVVTKESAPGGAGLDVKAWLSDLQPKRPHWWPASGGGGGRPGEGGGGENPWTAGAWNKTKQAQIYRDDKAKAERMAKAAGSSIGALNPPEKK